MAEYSRTLLAATIAMLSSCASVQQPGCAGVISEFELYRELAKDPLFSNGVPPPGKQMRVERELCGYRVHVGVGSADSFGGDMFVVDAQGKIIDVIRGY